MSSLIATAANISRWAARYLERTAVYADSDAERLLNCADVTVMLSEQFSEETMVVEMEFERIFAG